VDAIVPVFLGLAVLKAPAAIHFSGGYKGRATKLPGELCPIRVLARLYNLRGPAGAFGDFMIWVLLHKWVGTGGLTRL